MRIATSAIFKLFYEILFLYSSEMAKKKFSPVNMAAGSILGKKGIMFFIDLNWWEMLTKVLFGQKET